MLGPHDDPRLFVPHEGIVVDVKDERGMHMIRARIPGFIDADPVTGEVATTRWAKPLTLGGGSPQRGGHVVPAVGSQVVIWFLGGSIKAPAYQSYCWAENTLPQRIAESGADAHLVQSFQVGSFAMTIDERPRDAEAGTGQLVEIADLSDVVEGDPEPATTITFDLLNKTLDISAGALLRLRAAGRVHILAPEFRVNDSVFRPGRDTF